MRPLQLWLPTFFGGIARPQLRADRQRLFRSRTVEQVMWTKPGWRGPRNWKQDGLTVGCLNGDALECVRIMHVSENGVIVGPASGAFSGKPAQDLLDAWLNVDFVRMSSRDAGVPLVAKAPQAVKGGVAMADVRLTIPTVHELPFAHVGEGQRAYAVWPSRAEMPATVSPELETARPAFDKPSTGLHMQLTWAAPFAEAQPLIVSLDDVLARDRMRRIAEDSGAAPAKGLAEAQAEAAEWLSEGRATINEAWLWPILAEEGEAGALFAIEARFGIAAETLGAAYDDARLRAALNAQRTVTRAWGVPGLMWALLIERLAASQSFQVCERCGRRNPGKADKRFCSQADNPECFRARRAGDRRGERIRNRGRRRSG